MGAKKWKDEKSGEMLTVKEKDFVKLYVFGGVTERGNASECYRKIFLNQEKKTQPKSESIWHYAWEIMKKPRIKEAIHVYQKDIINADWITNELAKDALDNTAKHADRIRAKELLGKSLGMFVDKTEVNIKTDAIFEEEA